MILLGGNMSFGLSFDDICSDIPMVMKLISSNMFFLYNFSLPLNTTFPSGDDPGKKFVKNKMFRLGQTLSSNFPS